MDAREHARLYVERVVHDTIRRPSARDRQAAVGPSDISDPCDLCLATKMSRRTAQPMGKGRESGFSFTAWTGTAVHEKLERDLDLPDGHAATEEEVFIHHIPGYGDIVGHIDVQFLRMSTAVDYKTAYAKDIRQYKVSDVPWKHVRQLMMYGLGVRKATRTLDHVALVYIPRDSNNVNDIWVAAADYDESIALEALERADSIWKRVSQGDTDFSSHPECFPCKMTHLGMLR